MTQRAVLMLDPQRRLEQIAFIAQRDPNYREFGERIWALLDETQADIFAREGILVQFQTESDLVEVPAGVFRAPAEVPQPPADLAATEPTGSDRAYYIVLFLASLPEFVDGVTALEGELIDDLPGPAVIFKLTSEQAAQVRALSYVVWIGLYHPAYALHYDLAGSSEPLNAVAIGRIAVDPTRVVDNPDGNLQVVPFADVPPGNLQPALEAAGATMVNNLGYAMVISAPASSVPDLLRVPGLHALERHVPATLSNQRAAIIIGADQVRNFRRTDFLVNLNGAGETVHVYDSGLDNGNGFPIHPDLAGRVNLPISNANAVAITADFEMHGTHVAGTIAGDGSSARGARTVPTGIAPAAQIEFTSVNAALPPDTAPNRNPAQARLSFANFLPAFTRAAAAGARVHNNSWGNDAGNAYTPGTSGQIDRYCFLNPEEVVVFAAGNSEADANNDGMLDMTFLGVHATAKNIITVGACENDTNLDGLNGTYPAVLGARFLNPALAPLNGPAPVDGNFPMSDNPNQTAMFSERGLVANAPGAPRRVKPDLVAPGTNVVSTTRLVVPAPGPAGGPGNPLPAPASAPAASYGVITGTSMATPMVSGCCALVRQFYRSLFGQLRRPVQMEAVHSLIDNPAVTPHRDGFVICWVRPGCPTTLWRRGSRRIWCGRERSLLCKQT
jgi:hypothetical protein